MNRFRCPSGHTFMAAVPEGGEVACNQCGAAAMRSASGTMPAVPASKPAGTRRAVVQAPASRAPRLLALGGLALGVTGVVAALVVVATSRTGDLQTRIEELQEETARQRRDLQAREDEAAGLRSKLEEALRGSKSSGELAQKVETLEKDLREAQMQLEQERLRYASLAEKVAQGQAKPAPAPAQPAKPRDPTAADVFSRCADGVVVIRTDQALGSGFVVSPDGLIVTNNHVVAGARTITVGIAFPGPQGRQAFNLPGQLVATDVASDLALVKIDTIGRKPLVLPPADLTRLAVGDKVIAIGNPGFAGQALELTVTEGIVSGALREIEGVHCVQTSTAINPGNSGGPLLTMEGRVIGVVTMKAREMEATGFAVAISHVQRLVEQKDTKYKHDPSKPAAMVKRDKLKREGCTEVEIGSLVTRLVIDEKAGVVHALDMPKGLVHTISLKEAKIVKSTFVGESPVSMALDATGELLVSLPTARAIMRLEPRAGLLKEQLDVRVMPGDVLYFASKKRLFYADAQTQTWYTRSGIQDSAVGGRDLRGALAYDPGRDLAYIATGRYMWVVQVDKAEDLVARNARLHASRERGRDWYQQSESIDRQLQECTKTCDVPFDGLASPLLYSRDRLIYGRLILDSRKPGTELSRVPVNPHSLSTDPDVRVLFQRYPQLSYIYAVSRDGKLAASGTYLYEGSKLAPVRELPALSLTSEFTSDGKTLVMFDLLTGSVVIMPVGK